jgi:hypothetical protein
MGVCKTWVLSNDASGGSDGRFVAVARANNEAQCILTSSEYMTDRRPESTSSRHDLARHTLYQ